MVPPHLTNGSVQVSVVMKKKEALEVARAMRANGIFACIWKDGKGYSVWAGVQKHLANG